MARSLKIKGKVCLAALFCLFANGSHAAAITNLSGRTQVIEVEDRSDPSGFSPVAIEDGMTARLGYGDVTVRFRGHRSRLEYNIDYAILEQGGISPQRTRNDRF